MKIMYFTAICGYPGLKEFAFFNVDFSVEQWSDLEKVGQSMVEKEWAKISPHPTPTVLHYVPGGIVQLSDEDYKAIHTRELFAKK